jgi:transposase
MVQDGWPCHPQVLWEPTSSVSLLPDACTCGHGEFSEVTVYHTHQVIALPVIRPAVTHWILQSCVAHLLHMAKGLAERVEAGIARFGGRVHAEIQRLCHMGVERPTVGQGRVGYARCHSLLNQYATREDKAGTFARRLAQEGESLWVFLDVQGVEATNNIAGRAHRFGVMWRKCSQGTRSEKGNRWVEQVLSLRHTCRIRGRPTLPILVEAISCLFKGESPDLSWLTQHESLPVPSTP